MNPERGHQPSHHRDSLNYNPQLSDIYRYNESLEQVQLVHSLIYLIDSDQYMRRHKNMGADWQVIFREKNKLQNFKDVFKARVVRDAIGVSRR